MYLPSLNLTTREEKQLNFGFLLKGGGGAQPKSKAIEKLFKEPVAGKKVPQTCPKIQGRGGVKAVQ